MVQHFINGVPDQPETAREASPVDRLRDFVQEYMIQGSRSPMEWMIDLLVYGQSIDHQTTSDGDVSWIESKVMYQGVKFTMEDFKSMIHSLVHEAKKHLFEKLLFEFNPPPVDWSELADSPGNHSRRFNFTVHEFNHKEGKSMAARGCNFLLSNIDSDPILQAKIRTEGFKKQYLENVAEFRQYMLLLMHLTGGQPARGTEILGIRHTNRRIGVSGNIFVDDGLVSSITEYHKGYNTSGKSKVIHRFLPREVGELLVW